MFLKNIKAFLSEGDSNEIQNISITFYSNYESGEREMPLNLLEKAADLFGCELYVFFEENFSEDMILATAFRIEDLNSNDLQEIIHFKDIVKSYIKMDQHF